MPILLEGLHKFARWRKAPPYKDHLSSKNSSSGMGFKFTKSGVNDSYS